MVCQTGLRDGGRTAGAQVGTAVDPVMRISLSTAFGAGACVAVIPYPNPRRSATWLLRQELCDLRCVLVPMACAVKHVGEPARYRGLYCRVR